MHLDNQRPAVGDLASAPFIREAFALYGKHRPLFLRILLPAIVLGYVAVMAGNYKSEEMLSQLPRGREALNYLGTLAASSVARLLGLGVSWILYCFAYAATCVAVASIERDVLIGAEESYSAVRERLNRFFPISFLLFVFLLIGLVIVAVIVGVVLPYVTRWIDIPAIGIFTVMMFGFGTVIFAIGRLSLSIPAVIVGNYRTGESLFLSDELTERRSVVVGALLLEGVVGTYLAAFAPYWIVGLLLGDALWPAWIDWALHASAILAAAIVQPGMFVGFALLYLRAQRLKMSGTPSITLTASHS